MINNNESEKHTFITEIDDRLNYKLSTIDMLLDIKVLLKEYYIGTFTDDGKSLKITFNNGQKFLLTLKEI